MQTEHRCYICGAYGDNLQVHHALSGTSNRKWSEKYGLKVWLCPRCHADIHDRHINELELKQDAQRKFEEVYGNRDEFRRIFGKSFL